jgi:hypothetical protein
MTKSLSRALSYLFSFIPLGFGALRAASTGSDYRYLVIALAMLATTFAILTIGAKAIGSRALLAVATAIGSTAVGAAIARLQGANSVAAIVFVTLGFALCFLVSGLLSTESSKM